MILCVCLNPSIDTFIWLDHVRPGEVHPVKREMKFPGGKGVHVAMALRELGNEVALLGFWGGATGDWIRSQCEAQGIAVHGPRLDEWTRTCLTFRSESDFDETEILGTGPTVSKEDRDILIDTFKALLKQSRLVAVSGSIPPGLDPGLYANLIILARESGIPVFLDCKGEFMTAALVEHPYGLHMNRLEARTVTGESNPAAAAGLLLRHCEWSCVTDGAKGAYLACASETWHSVCQVDNGHSAVGSGDCLMAGLCSGHVSQLPLEDVARLAAACGAANLMRAELGMLYASDVLKLLIQTQVQRWK